MQEMQTRNGNFKRRSDSRYKIPHIEVREVQAPDCKDRELK